jgi:hypothetical protein
LLPAVVVATQNGTMNFYAVAAQIVPLLFVVLAFERRWFDDPPEINVPDALMRILVVAYFAIGEVAALNALYHGKASSRDGALVTGALAIGGTALLVDIALQRLGAIGRRIPPERAALKTGIETAVSIGVRTVIFGVLLATIALALLHYL